MSNERDELARDIFVYDNGRLDQAAAETEWEDVRGPNEPQYAYQIADGLLTAGYRKIFDGDCGLSGVKDPSDKEAAEAWMRWANLAMNDEIGAIGAMKQMLTEFGYRKVEATK